VNKNISFMALFLFFSFSLTSCSIYHVDSRQDTLRYYPPKKDISEVVYLEKVERPYEVIGRVTVNTERRQRLSDVMTKMKREAAILGADAFTNIRTDASGAWKSLPAQEVIGNAYVRANFTADLIVFK